MFKKIDEKYYFNENIYQKDFESLITNNYFEYSNRKTKEIMHLLTEEDIENIRKEVCTGGQK